MSDEDYHHLLNLVFILENFDLINEVENFELYVKSKFNGYENDN